ncbi:UNVERIFIED_CONTAM: Retrovirus-related Pol polyprotein from transposon TNT 1-94 [Sesamum calycinum]|uniref:Retrovirus-related Pol polyprotein from transposon TNT 1-94 n=1 Tax=Sesamum calycinum TaxID=2727403 RepID=A0AAW2MR40_9LAMI
MLFFENIFPCKDRKEEESSRKRTREVANGDHQRDEESRRSKRAKRAKTFGLDFLTYLLENELRTINEALSSPEAPLWKEAINSEIESIMQNYTWELVDLPSSSKPLGCKWILKRKYKTDGSIDKYKARITSIRVLIAVVALYDLEILQMDDDMLIMGSNRDIILTTKKMLTKHFDMKDMGLADVILRIKISKTSDGLALSQSHYVETILRKFKAYDSPPAKTPVDLNLHLAKNKDEPECQIEYSRIIGSLMYIMNCTRPDIAYAVNKLSRFTSNPSKDHWKLVLHGIYSSIALKLEKLKWLRNFLEDIPCWTKPVPAIMVHCDSQSAIGRAQSSMCNGKSRHIHRRHNTIRQLISSGIISIDYIKSKDNLVDPLAKGLSRDQVYYLSREWD